ncbi:hypothetical protein GLOIN_2v1880292 [Rhizophagus irregularis DAOM 181602=DAOM 197198]|uniref:Uncharacterized protein n=1 Tax=Rhizophagus irregularis (strain DAOM 181602 / DAOM 197198 / MUCL 43194) TaxID=747089 RepID=A0A2P4PK76_RHIID|nr:hypothetical protein GLOIN_2v1880292 [Rhizophagus irregularis DAOM 181602=DAOM 197198]POG65812.1 hypothetical protein GLOIN_2v1880292 [Rhizophagus irregularis DAOM 181602=DAOM 197198]|eukprot:XP_025172678.1 hypothetical protein GLOIN_2v1880292 [Rhizophagus irregularis DAOM 181602=DAOM 197198]
MNEMKIDNINSYEKEIKYKEPLIRQVNHGPFSDDEKNYIYEWANNRTKNCDAIRWEFLQIEIQNNFVSQGPFSDSEKDYIYKWVNSQKDCDVIRWEFLQRKIQEIFGIFRLRNDLKYQWNRKRRQISRQCGNTKVLSTLNEVDERTPQSNLTEKIDPPVCKVNHDPFSYSEKSYIYEDCDVIRWELLQSEIQRKYGKLRNALKSKWNQKMIYLNYLEPLINQVNHGPFTDSEKNYIYEWVSRQNDCDVIRWELLQYEIQKEYGKFRLRNNLKYQWNCTRRQISRQHILSTLNEVDERTPQSNLTEEKINCMDPLVCKVNHDPFSDSEKSYIYEDCDVIRWDEMVLNSNGIEKI